MRESRRSWGRSLLAELDDGRLGPADVLSVREFSSMDKFGAGARGQEYELKLLVPSQGAHLQLWSGAWTAE